MINKFLPKFSIFFVLFLFLANIYTAEAKLPSLCGIEAFTGFAKAKLRDKGNYFLAPLIVDLNFDLKPSFEKIGLYTPGMCQFQLEPFISAVYSPENNVEIGNSFMLKVGILPETSVVQPYAKIGVGLLYMTQHTDEQGTQFNFLEQGCIGAHYYFTKKMALTGECRFRHVSNSGIGDPNKGINSLFFLLGIAYRY